MNRKRSNLPLRSFNFTESVEDRSISSLGTPDSSGDDFSSSSDEDSRYDSTRLLRDIKEALDASRQPGMYQSPAYSDQTDSPPMYQREYNNFNQRLNDDVSMMDVNDEHLIEEQFRILQQIEQEKAFLAKSNQNPIIQSKVDDPSSALAKSEKMGYSDPKLREWEGKLVKLLDVEHSKAAIATGDAFYIQCTGCSSMLGFPKESTHLYCPFCHALHTLPPSTM